MQVDAADAAQAARDAGYGHLAPVVGELGGRAVDMEARRFSVVVLEDGNGGAQVVHDHAPGVGAQSSPSRPGPSPEWSVGMQDVVTKVGLHSPSPGMVPLREMASNAEHRLRIVEEDRDLLAQQAVALQRMLDKERRDRQAAQGAQQQAQQALRELVKGDAAKVKAEHERLVELHAQAAHLRTRVETAARSGKGAAPGLLEVLQERAERAEAAAGGQREQRQRVEQEAVRRLALSLKVLQLQKESADRAVLAKQRAQAHNDAARDEAARLREEEQRKDDALAGHARRLEAWYAEEGRMMRQLHQIRADTAAFARVMRAEAARMRLFEEGLERELQEAEHEVKVHKHIADEMGLEAAQVFGPAAWDSSAAGNMLRAQAQRDAALPTEPRAAPEASGKQPAPPGRRVPAPGKAAPRRGVARR